jgi:hypothetical protein
VREQARLAKNNRLRSSSILRAISSRLCQLGVVALAGHEAKRIVMDDAEGLRRRAENLRALAKKARDDRYTQLADYISAKADRLFEEARAREPEPSSSSPANVA